MMRGFGSGLLAQPAASAKKLRATLGNDGKS